jgi:hypothetical protein
MLFSIIQLREEAAVWEARQAEKVARGSNKVPSPFYILIHAVTSICLSGWRLLVYCYSLLFSFAPLSLFRVRCSAVPGRLSSPRHPLHRRALNFK